MKPILFIMQWTHLVQLCASWLIVRKELIDLTNHPITLCHWSQKRRWWRRLYSSSSCGQGCTQSWSSWSDFRNSFWGRNHSFCCHSREPGHFDKSPSRHCSRSPHSVNRDKGHNFIATNLVIIQLNVLKVIEPMLILQKMFILLLC